MNIAVLLTVFNWREKTIRCLQSLEESHQQSLSEIRYTVFLTDDGSTDCTATATAQRLPL